MANPDKKGEARPRFCDVVMKGGITSGVVYPKAVVTLAETFRLKNIGGTSAGAIAAAAAAAAEFATIRGSDTGGYPLLAGLPDFLSRQNAPGKTNLFTFFQPQPKTNALFDTLTGALEANGGFAMALKLLGRAAKHFWIWPLLGILAGVGLAWIEVSRGWWPLGVLWLFLGLAGGILALAARFVCLFGSRVPGADGGNYFGLCTGMSSDPRKDTATGASRDGQALTVWLTKYLNELAGLDPDGAPLTFGQLWNPEAAAGTPFEGGEKAICLEMFATCLSKGRPFRLPFREDEEVKENVCYFREDDLRKFFPSNVVNWMKAHPRQSSRKHREIPEGFYRMPDPWDLPVVVATRMSLSFPILLSAVRLWAFEPDFEIKAPKDEPQGTADSGAGSTVAGNAAGAVVKGPSPCWFSDGGICSNFPIHLFDAPLPRWATFGINLVEKPENTPDEDIATPWMPNSNNQGIQETWTKLDESGGIGSLAGFISAIIGTMQNWQDNTLSRMPGYRDRIAQVGLRPSEGGLNLNMPEDRIEKLTARGNAAAQEFIGRFSDGAAIKGRMNWANHRWLRFRSLMGALEEMIESMDQACKQPEPGDAGYEAWVKSLAAGQEPSYSWKGTLEQRKAQRSLAIETLQELRKLAVRWESSDVPAAEGAPRPLPELQPRPRI